MGNVFRTLVAVLVAASGALAAQEPSAGTDPDRAARARIDAFMDHLVVRPDDTADEARFYAELDVATDLVRREIRTFVETRVSPTDRSADVEGRLRRLLAGHEPNPEYDDRPTARVADLRYGRAMVVAYTLVRGSHQHLACIEGYRETADRAFRLVATSDDFQGRSMFLRGLPSPVPGELWFLGWGRVLVQTVRWRGFGPSRSMDVSSGRYGTRRTWTTYPCA